MPLVIKWEREFSRHFRARGLAGVMPKVTVFVTLKPTLLDAQGRTVQTALHSLGFGEAGSVRIGKIIEMEVPDGDTDGIRVRAAAMCDELLANPVTESYRIEVEG